MTPTSTTRNQTLAAHAIRLSALAVATAAAVGCSMFNPYEHFAVLPPAAEGAGGQAKALEALGFKGADRLAGGAYEALAEVDTLRAAMYADMRGMALARSTATVIGVVSSSWAVYSAFRGSLSGDTTGFSKSDRDRAGRLALVASTSYGLGQFFVNPEQENIYAAGYNALTCLALQSRPLLMPSGTDQVYEQHVKALGDLKGKVDSLQKLVAETSIGVARAATWLKPALP
jgi:hypothetical protein